MSRRKLPVPPLPNQAKVLRAARRAYERAKATAPKSSDVAAYQQRLKRLRNFRRQIEEKYKSLPMEVRTYIDAGSGYGGLGKGVEDWRLILKRQIGALAHAIREMSPREQRLRPLVAYTEVLKRHWPSDRAWTPKGGGHSKPSPAEEFIISYADKAGLPRITETDARTVTKRLKIASTSKR
jgi:hypothetical protein